VRVSRPAPPPAPVRQISGGDFGGVLITALDCHVGIASEEASSPPLKAERSMEGHPSSLEPASLSRPALQERRPNPIGPSKAFDTA
jgi:hypothetical protein